jgi:hypothetical protein
MNDPFFHHARPFSLHHSARARYGGRNVAQGLGIRYSSLSDVCLRLAAPLGDALVGAPASLDDVARALSMPRVSLARVAARSRGRVVADRSGTRARELAQRTSVAFAAHRLIRAPRARRQP